MTMSSVKLDEFLKECDNPKISITNKGVIKVFIKDDSKESRLIIGDKYINIDDVRLVDE